jgi:hypothetical protein
MIDIVGMVLPALIPGLLDGVKGLFQRLFGGTKPVTADEQIKLMKAEAEKLTSLAEIDKVYGEPSKWVTNLRASFRYLAASFIFLLSLVVITTYIFTPESIIASGKENNVYDIVEILLQMDGSLFFFLFGDRVYINLKKR